MTPKEAIERIQSRYLVDEDCNTESKDFEALDTAKEALEKLIPKKPNKTRYSDGSLCCPECLWDGFDETYEKSLLSYCPSCGQALDWGEKE